ncbi:hypothetical protein BB559_002047 [Furculomyces boomerangus]|uniref:Uncharacterized protein n=1 Tax=Furculomyces boomerangus TaxID=61424 RepID=A0A2T9YYM6_9FUNG|nr:hypothetical protein BB559_002047 [Furculomyces boomerangus]
MNNSNFNIPNRFIKSTADSLQRRNQLDYIIRNRGKINLVQELKTANTLDFSATTNHVSDLSYSKELSQYESNLTTEDPDANRTLPS